MLCIIATFAFFILTYLHGLAASLHTSLEAEEGTLDTNTTKEYDSLASGNYFIKFGSDNRYIRPYGNNAPWNQPVTGLPLHPESQKYRDLLWDKGPGTSGAGNFNTVNHEYTYPVYYATEATREYPVVVSYTSSNLQNKTIPWNPAWNVSSGSDGQAIIIDPLTGREWNLWQVSFRNDTVHITNGNLVPGNYFTKEDGFSPSRGVGIQYLAMLLRPQEVEEAIAANGPVQHALSMPINNTDGTMYVPPATKLEHPGTHTGIPEGTRFALQVTDQEIETWLSTLPNDTKLRKTAKVFAKTLRDYGWFITDSAGGAKFQLEDRVTAGSKWDALGFTHQLQFNGKTYPNDLTDGLITKSRIYTIAPSDQY